MFDKNKWDVKGVEPSPTLSKLAKKYFNLDIINSFLEDFQTKEKFDVITLVDVFEHISNPKIMLKKIKDLLKNDGIILIKVPNGRFSLFKQKIGKKFFKNQDVWDSYEHVIHYDSDSIKRMLSIADFKVIRISPAPPIQLPGWENYVGAYYQYKSPIFIEFKQKLLRMLFYLLSKIYYLVSRKILFLSQNIYVIAKKAN